MLKKIIKPVYAHCDIPCGIYETDTMAHAAATCLRMVEKIEELGKIDSPEKHNNFVRDVMNKEKHAQIVKEQLSMLWTDYFKPEHLDKFPKLHETIWLTAKAASKAKQTVSREACEDLIARVAEVAEMFAQSKK